MKQKYQAMFFDLDGTLVDTAPDIHRALCHCLRKFDLPIVAESLTRHWVGTGSRRLMFEALQHHGIPEPADAQVEAMLAVFLDHYEAHIADHSALYPGVASTLPRLLDAGVKLAVVTNKFEALSESVLTALNIRHLFATNIGGDTCATNKPSAAPAALAGERLSVTAEQTLFVGDSETDVGCARSWGCDVVAVPYGYNRGTPAEALQADGVIEDCGALLGYLQRAETNT